MVMFAVASMVFATQVSAQDDEEEESTLSISGSIDTYYRANLNATNNARKASQYGLTTAPGTSFANQQGFALGMANLIVAQDGEKTGFVADLVFGPRGNEAVFGSTQGSSPIVNQLYGYWNVSDAVTLTLGNFNTFLGYEVISPTANFNYSTSYMFSYGPFSHTGVKADVALGDLSLMFALMNPTDATEFNPNNHYYGGFQAGYGGAYLNFLFDGGDYFQVDLTAGWDLTDALYLGVNATSNKDLFAGGALYLQNSFSDDFSLGLRGEYFVDQGIGLVTLDESIIDLTLSANYTVGSLTFIPEFRVDMVGDMDEFATDVELDSSGIPSYTTSTSLSSFVFAVVYAF